MNENIVKKVCKELGLTYKQLGERIGYSENAVSNAARGKVSPQMKKAIELYLKTLELEKKLEKCESLRNSLKDFIS